MAEVAKHLPTVITVLVTAMSVAWYGRGLVAKLSTDVQEVRSELIRLNGAVAENTVHRRALELNPPWQEVLIQQAAILGRMDEVSRIIREVEGQTDNS